MNRALLLVFIALLGLYALLPAREWTRPRVPAVPTHVPSTGRVAHCQRLASRWDPSRSDTSLHAWTLCMRLRRR